MDISQLNICYSCQLKKISVGAEFNDIDCAFSISRRGSIIFSTSSVSFEGEAIFYGLDEIIEEDLRKSGRQYDHYTINFTCTEDQTAIREFICVYCSQMPEIDAAELIHKHFFNSLVTDECRPGKPVFLSFFAENDESALDTTARIGGTVYSNEGGIQGEFISCSRDIVTHNISGVLNPEDLSEFTLQVNKPTGPIAHFLCVNDEPDISFVFRNKFNAWQAIFLDATISLKTQNKRSIAKCADGSFVQYDKENKLSWEIKCHPVSWLKALAIAELLESHDVRILSESNDPNLMPKVIMEVEGIEIPRDPQSPITPKFSFSMADSVHSISFGKFPGLFADQFSLSFD